MIRKATIEDKNIITDFNYNMALETEDFGLDKTVLQAGVKNLLTDENKGIYYIYEKNGQAVGQTLITYEWSDWRNGWIWWIQSVYVAKEYRRLGIFREIYQYIKELAQENGVKGLRLYVEKENQNAMRTYEELGMVSERYNMYETFLEGER